MRRYAFLTGGSGGIGRSIRKALEAQDYEVLAPGREQLDLANLQSVQNYLDSLPTTYVPNVVVLGAGQNRPAALRETTIDLWRETFNVNVNSHFLIARELCSRIDQRKSGRIVAISSLYGSRARFGRGPYSASKAALESLVRSLAVEFSGNGILANSITPGFVDTELTRTNNSLEQISRIKSRIPLGELSSIDDVVKLVMFLLSEENTYINGQNFRIDGGYSIADIV